MKCILAYHIIARRCHGCKEGQLVQKKGVRYIKKTRKSYRFVTGLRLEVTGRTGQFRKI